MVLLILLYGSEVWRPWTRGSLRALDSFQRQIARRIAFRCGVHRDDIVIPPIVELLDAKDLKLANRFLESPEYLNLFEVRSTRTRSGRLFGCPRARNNLVSNSFKWRLSRHFNNL